MNNNIDATELNLTESSLIQPYGLVGTFLKVTKNDVRKQILMIDNSKINPGNIILGL